MLTSEMVIRSQEHDVVRRQEDGSVLVQAYVPDDPGIGKMAGITAVPGKEYVWQKVFTAKKDEICCPGELDRFRGLLPKDALCVAPVGFSRVKQQHADAWGMTDGNRYLSCARSILSRAVQRYLRQRPGSKLLFLHGASMAGLDKMSLQIVGKHAEHLSKAGITCGAFALYVEDKPASGGPVYFARSRDDYQALFGSEWIHLMAILGGRDTVMEQLFYRLRAGLPYAVCPIVDTIAANPPKPTGLDDQGMKIVEDTTIALRRSHIDLTRARGKRLRRRGEPQVITWQYLADRLAEEMLALSSESQVNSESVEFPW